MLQIDQRLCHNTGHGVLTGGYQGTVGNFHIHRIVNHIQLTRLDHDFAQDVIFLDNFDNTAVVAENILNNFCTRLDILTVFDIQQRNIFVDLVGFFRNPEQRTALSHLKALFCLTALGNLQAGKLNHAAGAGAVSIILELSHHFAAAHFATGCCFQQECLAIAGFQHIVFTSLLGFRVHRCLIKHH